MRYALNTNNVRTHIAAWHHDIAGYIKNDLGGNRHLISADYTGVAPMGDAQQDSNPCDNPESYDSSWQSPYIDVIAFSNYDASSNRREKMARTQYEFMYCHNGAPLDAYHGLPKPVVYAENGPGGPGDKDFNDCDHTYFQKDLLASFLSGHATSGMFWTQVKRPTYWYMFDNLRDFLETFVIYSHEFGSEIWKPVHRYSMSDDFDENNNNSHDNRRAEAVYLKRSNTPENPKIIGVIFNRTWNFYSVNGVECNAVQGDLGYEQELLGTVEEFGWSDEKILLFGLDEAEYTIRYHDSYDLHKVNEEIVQTSDGVLGLLNYPMMFDGTSDHDPFYFFLAFKEGSEWNALPEFAFEDSLVQQLQLKDENESFIEHLALTEEGIPIPNVLFDIYPNPMNEAFTLRTSLEGDFQINNLVGELVVQGKVSKGKNIINIAHLSSGVYLLKHSKIQKPISLLKID